MTKSKSNIVNAELDQELLDNIFNEEWYLNVSEAIDYALQNTQSRKDINKENLVKSIIDYNINKQLEEEVLNKLTDNLPNELDWQTIDVISAFNEFKGVIDTCDICPTFKKHILRIKIPEKSILNNEILIWKEIVNTNYPDILITSKKLKCSNIYKLTISKSFN